MHLRVASSAALRLVAKGSLRKAFEILTEETVCQTKLQDPGDHSETVPDLHVTKIN